MPRSITDHVIPSVEPIADVLCTQEFDGVRTSYLVHSGGETTSLEFAHYPIGEAFKHGVTNEALLGIVIDRLRGFQDTPLRCRENAVALTKLEEAMHWLHARTLDRIRRGVPSPHEA